MIRITKEFKFEMAHALHGYDGLCKNIHGHSYRLWVTVEGAVKNSPGNKKDGMLIDFADLKKIVKENIINKYDHSLVLNGNSPHVKIDLSSFEKVYYLPFQPTSENLVLYFVELINKKIPSPIKLKKIVLSETATSFAEWNSGED